MRSFPARAPLPGLIITPHRSRCFFRPTWGTFSLQWSRNFLCETPERRKRALTAERASEKKVRFSSVYPRLLDTREFLINLNLVFSLAFYILRAKSLNKPIRPMYTACRVSDPRSMPAPPSGANLPNDNRGNFSTVLGAQVHLLPDQNSGPQASGDIFPKASETHTFLCAAAPLGAINDTAPFLPQPNSASFVQFPRWSAYQEGASLDSRHLAPFAPWSVECSISETDGPYSEQSYSPIDSASAEEEWTELDSPNPYFSTLLHDARPLSEVMYDCDVAAPVSSPAGAKSHRVKAKSAKKVRQRASPESPRAANLAAPSATIDTETTTDDVEEPGPHSLARAGLKRLLYLSNRVVSGQSAESERRRKQRSSIGPFVKSFRIQKTAKSSPPKPANGVPPSVPPHLREAVDPEQLIEFPQ